MNPVAEAAAPGTQERATLDLALVGFPNVGKSALFNKLTTHYVTVSNYPGTTVGVASGTMRENHHVRVSDTPGMYSFLPLTDEERVSRNHLLCEPRHVVVHVADAKNVARHLPLTLELLAIGARPILFLNFQDEAEREGVGIDTEALSRRLGIPVLIGSAIQERGLDALRAAIDACFAAQDEGPAGTFEDLAPNGLAPVVRALKERLEGTYDEGREAVAWMVLMGDRDGRHLVEERESESVQMHLLSVRDEARARLGHEPSFVLATHLRRRSLELLEGVVQRGTGTSARRVRRAVEFLCENPVSGLPILLLILYFGFYQVVGVLGAGDLVDFLESTLFGEWVNPHIERLFASVPWQPVRDLFVGEYGMITMGITYALALVLPIVTLFFIVFSILEDSGYLPRLAMMVDRGAKKIGLSGRALIPLTLGFGCDTMATVVTRVQESRRERFITTLLLALAIPCSAQLGLFLGALAPQPRVLIAWVGIVLFTFLLVGRLAHRYLPGAAPTFHMELPPMRVPRPGNVFAKSYSRVYWYLREVLPLFLLISFLIWLGHQIVLFGKNVFDWCVVAIQPLVALLGLPNQGATAEAMFFGFFRRDYAAAHLIGSDGVTELAPAQLLVVTVVLTLFLPCIAQFLIIVKEQGLKRAASMSLFVFGTAFTVGALMNLILSTTGWLAA